MKTIFKYNFAKNDGHFSGNIVKILGVKTQMNNVIIYAEVDDDAPVREFHVTGVGTGWDLTDEDGSYALKDYEYLDTVLLLADSFVLHIYIKEIGKKEEIGNDKPTAKENITKSTNKTRVEKNNSKIDSNLLKNFI